MQVDLGGICECAELKLAKEVVFVLSREMEIAWSAFLAIVAIGCVRSATPTDDLASSVKFLQEQVSALLNHRQEDYNALEESLKRAMEKNTELLVLRDEVKMLR